MGSEELKDQVCVKRSQWELSFAKKKIFFFFDVEHDLEEIGEGKPG
jgi:hypothetical protein